VDSSAEQVTAMDGDRGRPVAVVVGDPAVWRDELERAMGEGFQTPVPPANREFSQREPKLALPMRGQRHHCPDVPNRHFKTPQRIVLHEVAHQFGVSDQRLIELDRF
jgi:hypothetical protein